MSRRTNHRKTMLDYLVKNGVSQEFIEQYSALPTIVLEQYAAKLGFKSKIHTEAGFPFD